MFWVFKSIFDDFLWLRVLCFTVITISYWMLKKRDVKRPTLAASTNQQVSWNYVCIDLVFFFVDIKHFVQLGITYNHGWAS